MTVALVTGSNSGIGRATAIHLARQGFDVYASMRNLDKADKLLAAVADAGTSVQLVQLDVGDDASVTRGVGEVLERAGQVDVLVNNAGVGGNAVTEESPISLYEEVMNANLYGAIRCTQAVLPGMRARGSGCIVNVSSVTGLIAAIGQSPYAVSKWAVEAMSEGLAQEVAPFGIRVVIIEPGITKSAIFAKNVDAPNQTGAYDAHYRRMFQFYAAGIPVATPPEEVGALIYEAVTTDKPQLRYACSWGGQAIADGRASMTDAEWVALGAIEDDDEYYVRFSEAFGVDIRPK